MYKSKEAQYVEKLTIISKLPTCELRFSAVEREFYSDGIWAYVHIVACSMDY